VQWFVLQLRPENCMNAICTTWMLFAGNCFARLWERLLVLICHARGMAFYMHGMSRFDNMERYCVEFWLPLCSGTQMAKHMKALLTKHLGVWKPSAVSSVWYV
jgi:hypothetical protein